MCSILGIEFIPLPKKDEKPVKPKRLSINSGLGGGIYINKNKMNYNSNKFFLKI